MAETTCIQGFAEAIASERKDRATCLLGLPELIAGIQCAPLTPRRLEWLRAFNNPFVCGGASSVSSLLQFLWFVSLEFSFDAGPEKRDAFIESKLGLDVGEAVEGIGEYLDRAFLDAPHGKPGKPYYAPAVGLYHSMNTSYPHGEWTLERTLDTPLAVIYQLIKVDDISKGCAVLNRRSDAVAVKWAEQLETFTIPMPELPTQIKSVNRADFASDEAYEAEVLSSHSKLTEERQAIIDAHEAAVIESIAQRRADGWLLMTQPSQNKDGSYSYAMQRKESE